jgi:hypothetical protein
MEAVGFSETSALYPLDSVTSHKGINDLDLY